MIKRTLKTGFPFALAAVTTAFTFIPESLLQMWVINPGWNTYVNILVLRLIIFLLTLLFVILALFCVTLFRKKIVLRSKDCIIEVRIKDLFELDANYLKVINFDECFTTHIGTNPGDIKAGSICGQYLAKHPITDEEINSLIVKHELRPLAKKSDYGKRICYESGKGVIREDFFLMSFAKLNRDGLGHITLDEYTACLNVLWRELDKYHGERNIAIPVFGSYITRFDDCCLSQQELLDVIICSYKTCRKRLKKPFRMVICCKRGEDFSINKVETCS